jgi:hypothetical protein
MTSSFVEPFDSSHLAISSVALEWIVVYRRTR